MLGLTLLTSLLLSGAARANPHGLSLKTPRAAYIMTNSPDNAVVSLKVHEDGSISESAFFSTGGNGEAAYFNVVGAESGPDSLLSQSPITIAGNLLFAVNPGSNTLSLFSIDPTDPTKLRVAAEPPAVLPGEFPTSVTASLSQRLVCVSLTGATNGISCASFDPAAVSLGTFDTLRPYGLSQTTPPLGPPNTASQVLFSDDGSRLRAFVKGNGTVSSENNGFVASYDVTRKGVAEDGTLTPGAPGAMLFGSANVPTSGLQETFTSDLAIGSRVYSYDAAGAGTIVSNQTIAAGAPCWTVWSDFTSLGYVSTVTNYRLVEVDVKSGSITRMFPASDELPGFTDMAPGGRFVFGNSPGTPEATDQQAVTPAVAVVDVSGDEIEEVTRFNITGSSVIDGRPAGMAVFY